MPSSGNHSEFTEDITIEKILSYEKRGPWGTPVVTGKG